MKKCIFVLILLMTLGAGVFAKDVITVAMFEYPPVYQNAETKGLSGDLVAAAFKASGVDVEWKFFPVTRMVESVKNGDVDCGIGGAVLFSAPEVASKVKVSSKIQYVSQTFLYDSRKYPSGIVFSKLSEMANYKIGVLGGSGINKFLEKTPELKMYTNPAHDGTAKQLQAQRIDVWAIVDLTGIMYMKKLFPEEANYYKYTKSFNLGDVSAVFSTQKDPQGIYEKKFKEGLAIIKKNGTYKKIMAEYYGGESLINKDAMTEDMR